MYNRLTILFLFVLSKKYNYCIFFTTNFLTLFYDKLISLLHVKSFKSVYELKRVVVYKTPQEPNITTCF